MKFNNSLIGVGTVIVGTMLFVTACGSSSPSPTSTCTSAKFTVDPLPNVTPSPVAGQANEVAITVNGNLCGNAAYQYPNEICTSVTLCSPSQPTLCQTINNVLLDTGSSGLRLFASVLTVPLNSITSDGQTLAECVQYGDGSSEWGKIQGAYVRLGNEPAVYTSIHVIDSNYATPVSACSSEQSYPDLSPEQTGFNGILGVGLWTQDCGNDCASDASNGQYFSCNGSDCSCGATVATSTQVSNPVALLPTDNAGVMLSFPSVASTGVPSLSGTMYLGIDTQSNNTPSSVSPGVSTYFTNRFGNMSTVFSAYNSTAMPAFIDSGSNGLFFPSPTGGLLEDCGNTHGSSWTGAYCPNSPQSLSAVNASARGSTSGTVNFEIGNTYSLLNSSNMVFSNYGADSLGSFGSAYFDWGLPFFFGRKVYVGFDGSTTSLGTGPYWAY